MKVAMPQMTVMAAAMSLRAARSWALRLLVTDARCEKEPSADTRPRVPPSLSSLVPRTATSSMTRPDAAKMALLIPSAEVVEVTYTPRAALAAMVSVTSRSEGLLLDGFSEALFESVESPRAYVGRVICLERSSFSEIKTANSGRSHYVVSAAALSLQQCFRSLPLSP